MVVIAAMGLQELANFKMAPGNCIEYRILAVGVNFIDIEPLVYKKLAKLQLSISSSVI